MLQLVSFTWLKVSDSTSLTLAEGVTLRLKSIYGNLLNFDIIDAASNNPTGVVVVPRAGGYMLNPSAGTPTWNGAEVRATQQYSVARWTSILSGNDKSGNPIYIPETVAPTTPPTSTTPYTNIFATPGAAPVWLQEVISQGGDALKGFSGLGAAIAKFFEDIVRGIANALGIKGALG